MQQLDGHTSNSWTRSAHTRGFLFLGRPLRPPTYGKTTLSRPNLFRHQDDIEGIHLGLREADVHISWIPAIVYMPFGSSVSLRFDA